MYIKRQKIIDIDSKMAMGLKVETANICKKKKKKKKKVLINIVLMSCIHGSYFVISGSFTVAYIYIVLDSYDRQTN
jgi:uncharacterized membrane protein